MQSPLQTSGYRSYCRHRQNKPLQMCSVSGPNQEPHCDWQRPSALVSIWHTWPAFELYGKDKNSLILTIQAVQRPCLHYICNPHVIRLVKVLNRKVYKSLFLCCDTDGRDAALLIVIIRIVAIARLPSLYYPVH